VKEEDAAPLLHQSCPRPCSVAPVDAWSSKLNLLSSNVVASVKNNDRLPDPEKVGVVLSEEIGFGPGRICPYVLNTQSIEPLQNGTPELRADADLVGGLPLAIEEQSIVSLALTAIIGIFRPAVVTGSRVDDQGTALLIQDEGGSISMSLIPPVA
jgi:hypothetical protein